MGLWEDAKGFETTQIGLRHKGREKRGTVAAIPLRKRERRRTACGETCGVKRKGKHGKKHLEHARVLGTREVGFHWGAPVRIVKGARGGV